MTRCPLKAGINLELQSMGYAECDGNDCQWWDEGIYDKHEAGCGLITRENRRV